MIWNLDYKSVLTILLFGGAAVWLIIHSILHAENRLVVIIKWLITLPLAVLIVFSVKLFGAPGVFVVVFCAIIISYLWTPHIGALLVSPLTSAIDGGNIPPEPRPFYSVAQAKQKQGRYEESIAGIRKQL